MAPSNCCISGGGGCNVASWVDPPSLRRIRGNPKQVLGARDPSRSDCPVSNDDAVRVAEHARHAHGADTVAICAVARVRLLPEVDCLIEFHRKVGRKSQALEGGAVRPKGQGSLEQATGGGYIPVPERCPAVRDQVLHRRGHADDHLTVSRRSLSRRDGQPGPKTATATVVTDQKLPRSRVPARGRCSLGEVNGLWRSLVAHLTGGQGVASSNLASPTSIRPCQRNSGHSQPAPYQPLTACCECIVCAISLCNQFCCTVHGPLPDAFQHVRIDVGGDCNSGSLPPESFTCSNQICGISIRVSTTSGSPRSRPADPGGGSDMDTWRLSSKVDHRRRSTSGQGDVIDKKR